MTYEEFAESIQYYLDHHMTGMNLVFVVVLSVSLVVFFIWFAFYLRSEYKRKKRTIDTFDIKPDMNLKYPGYHPGVFRDDDSVSFEKDEPYRAETEKEKDDEKPKFTGKINDEY